MLVVFLVVVVVVRIKVELRDCEFYLASDQFNLDLDCYY